MDKKRERSENLCFSDRYKVLKRLVGWIERHDYTGYDIYDGLKITRSNYIRKNRLLNPGITQFFKKCPINLRPFLGIQETRMPKTAGLCLNAYALMAASSARAPEDEPADHGSDYLERSHRLFDWLVEASCTGYSGCCWNFGFPYTFMFDLPTVVITAIVARGIHTYYLVTGRAEALEVLRSACDFILQDLHITNRPYGLCFSYTPGRQNCCYNASMLGAEILAKVYAITQETHLRDYALNAVEFALHHQYEDGHWNYDITDFDKNIERKQVDFHQGYVLESLFSIIHDLDNPPVSCSSALTKGMAFYRRAQFFDDGRSKWRIPKVMPIDIHNQAQGIITFSKLAAYDDEYLDYARTIADWTIQNMLDEGDYFYYQQHKHYTIRIPYMRWAQAWMMLALSTLHTAENVASETKPAVLFW